MSTILDSLQKSSNQRQANEGSLNQFNFSEKKTSSKKNIFYIVIFFMFLIAAYLGYDYWLNSQAENTTIAQSEKTTEKQPPKPTIKDKNVAKKPRPKNSDVKQKMLQLEARKKEEKLVTLNKPTQARKEETKKSEKPMLTLQKDEKQNIAKHEKIAINNIQFNKTKNDSKINPKPTQKIKTPQVQQQKYHYIYQLPFSIRKDIPKFKLTVHIYDEQPKNRLVVINGVKYVIDDMIEEKALVKDIIPEGVVLDFDGTEFLVPKL